MSNHPPLVVYHNWFKLCYGGSGSLAGGGLGESESPTGEGLHRRSCELVYPTAGAFDTA